MLTLFPLIWVVKIAFSGEQGFSSDLSPIPANFSLKNFTDIIAAHDTDGNWLFGRQLFNSIIVSAATTIIGIFLACTAAYSYSRFKFTGRRTGLLMFLVSQMFPGVMMMIPLYVIMEHLRLLDTLFGLILVYSTTSLPFSVWMLKGYFDTIPRDIEEAALIDGASSITIFYRIILPLSLPAIAITALFSFMTAWNEFVLAYTFMNDQMSFTLPVTIRNFVGEKNIQWGYFAASSIIASIPVMTLFFILQKNLVSGLTAGSVKG
jgi:arabinogalactan oligomer/maltooligosaccharide transport system permease protein